MKIECVLELMKEKDYIDICEYGEEPMPLIHGITNHRGREFGSKLFKAIVKSENYIAEYGNKNFPEITIAKKTDIDEWLKTITKETTKIRWTCGRLDTKLFRYMEEKGFKTHYGISGFLEITNLKVEKERLKEIERKDQEAVDLLDQLL